MKQNTRISKKWLILLFILIVICLLFGFFYLVFINSTKKPSVALSPVSNTLQPSPTAAAQPEVAAEKITKCQSVVVTPQVTTELFLYIAGKKIRADYRIGANTEVASFKTQLLFNGDAVYLWQPPLNFGGAKLENPPGFTSNKVATSFQPRITENGLVERFGGSAFSGDYLCNEWDGVDPVFEVPADFVFDTSEAMDAKLAMELAKICQICDSADSAESKTICLENLVCNQ